MKKLSISKNVNKSDLTYRQHAALSLICTRFKLEKRYPALEEIKEVAGFKTDNLLDACLRALERKGFLKLSGVNGNLSFEITSKKILEEFSDKLIITQERKTYKDIKELLNDNKTLYKDFLEDFRSDMQLQLFKKNVQMKIFRNEDEKTLAELHNEGIVHNWYDYLQDFPYRLIWDKIKEYNITAGQRILDPFAGSGTTLVTSKMLGIDSIGIEANPLMCLVSKVKTTWDIDLTKLKEEANSLLNDLHAVLHYLARVKVDANFIKAMSAMELNQWLKPVVQNEVAYTKERIKEISNTKIRNLFFVALAKAAFESSNVALCPGTSFYPHRFREPFHKRFTKKLVTMYHDLRLLHRFNSFGKVTVLCDDCRKAPELLGKNSVDFVITSPPYPNDLEYTRQTRLEMYILDFVKNMQDVKDIKRRMVKSSTKLIFKEDNNAKLVEKFNSVQTVAEEVHQKLKSKNWGWDYPRMIREYFGDMYECLKKLKIVMRKNSYCLLVVGDQTYKEITIPVGSILAELAEDIGFSSTKIELFRVRRSTIHDIPLREEIVIVRK